MGGKLAHFVLQRKKIRFRNRGGSDDWKKQQENHNKFWEAQKHCLQRRKRRKKRDLTTEKVGKDSGEDTKSLWLNLPKRSSKMKDREKKSFEIWLTYKTHMKKKRLKKNESVLAKRTGGTSIDAERKTKRGYGYKKGREITPIRPPGGRKGERKGKKGCPRSVLCTKTTWKKSRHE